MSQMIPNVGDPYILQNIVRSVSNHKPSLHDFSTSQRATTTEASVAILLRMNPMNRKKPNPPQGNTEEIHTSHQQQQQQQHRCHCNANHHGNRHAMDTMYYSPFDPKFYEQQWVQSGRLEILFIKRQMNPNDRWSGHVAFPGGKKAHEEEDLLETCVREVKEEIGIDLSTKDFVCIGKLDRLLITGGFMVQPFLFLQVIPELKQQQSSSSLSSLVLTSPISSPLTTTTTTTSSSSLTSLTIDQQNMCISKFNGKQKDDHENCGPYNINFSEIHSMRYIPFSLFLDTTSKNKKSLVKFPLFKSGYCIKEFNLCYQSIILPCGTQSMDCRVGWHFDDIETVPMRHRKEVYNLWGLSLYVLMNLMKITRLPRLFEEDDKHFWGTLDNGLLDFFASQQHIRRFMIKQMLRLKNKKQLKEGNNHKVIQSKL